MADNTATIFLEGEVSLEEFSKTISNFNELIRALSDESGAEIEWILADLSVGSAMASVAGIGNEAHVQKVLTDYSDVGQALQTKKGIPHSERTKSAANKIVSISDRRIKTLRFETAKREVVIPLSMQLADQMMFVESFEVAVAPTPTLKPMPGAYGAIQGRIQTLTSRGTLRFTLYDLFYDKAVSCYLTEGKQEIIRGLWGKLTLVEGFVVRDPVTARPLSIREVSNITALAEPAGRFDYQDARGILPSPGLSPEQAIRRIRDAQ